MKVRLCQLFIFLSVLVGPVWGQTLDRESLEEGARGDYVTPPSSRLVDRGGVFEGKDAERELLLGRLDRLASEHGFSVYFVAYSGVIGSDVAEKAQSYRDTWLGAEEEGLVLVCDTDMRQMAYALTKADGVPVGDGRPPWKLPDHEAMAAMQALSKRIPVTTEEDDYLAALGHALASELEGRLQAQKGVREPDSWGLLGSFAGTVLFIFAGIWWVQRRAEAKASSRREAFPEIKVGKRLGAQLGGGMSGEMSYRSAAPRGHS